MNLGVKPAFVEPCEEDEMTENQELVKQLEIAERVIREDRDVLKTLADEKGL